MRALRHPALWLGGALTTLVVGTALLSLVWTPRPPAGIRVRDRLKPPFGEFLFGSDPFGRDVLSMLMAGAWNSLTIALAAVAIGLIGGVCLGLLAAARRGWTDEAVMRLSDFTFAFPAVLSAVMLSAAVGPGASTAVVAIGVFNIPVFARLTRAAALQVFARDFVLAARAAGKGSLRIAAEHVLPNITGVLVVQATIQLALAILAEAGLSYLGLGLQPPSPSWGKMLFESQTYLDRAPWLAIFPGLAIAVAVLGLNLLGDGLRDLLDPRLRRAR